MCFAIPYRVLKVDRDTATVEGGRRVKFGNSFQVKKGDYLQVMGSIAVGKISKTEGLRVRNLIKTIYEGKQTN